MDPLDKTTIRTVELATYARNAYKAGHPLLVCKYLEELYNFLTDELAGSAPEPCESAKSSKGKNHKS